MYKLIAIDLDGTLLNSEKRISSENKSKLQLAMDRGVKVVVCSGRVYSGARVYAREIGSNGPLIACNGAIIREMDTESFLYSNTMTIDDSLKVIDICRSEDIYFHIYIGDTLYTEKLGYSSLLYYNRNIELPEKDRIDIRVIDNIKEIIKKPENPVAKILVIDYDRDKLRNTRKIIEEIKGVQVMSSGKNNIEIVNAGVNKGKSLEILADKLGVRREQVVAIGDNENDLSMLEFAGLGIAMGNAEEYVKETANYVTLTNNENGVAHVIDKFILADR